jgi:hypothetical protein
VKGKQHFRESAADTTHRRRGQHENLILRKSSKKSISFFENPSNWGFELHNAVGLRPAIADKPNCLRNIQKNRKSVLGQRSFLRDCKEILFFSKTNYS